MAGGLIPAEVDVRLAMDEVQGGIVPGFKADHQHLRGVRFADAASARQWVAAVAPRVTPASALEEHKELARQGLTSFAPQRPWVSVAFTYPALQMLGFAGQFADPAFKTGMEKRWAKLGDDRALQPGWKVGGGTPVHALLVVAAVSADAARDEADALTAGYETPYRDEGATLPERGHEHFGFRDGVSQPGLLGVSSTTGAPLTPRDWDTPPDDDVLQARPGTVLIWPGEFVFGYPEQTTAQHERGQTLHAGGGDQTLTDNGSYLVLRRLNQDVELFHRVCREKAEELARTDWPGLTPELLEALIVGRWPSGAPVDPTAPADPGADAEHPPNAFDFRDDADGKRCPFGAHIRKVNPRADPKSDVTPLVRRFLRRGIPFGRKLDDPAADGGVERGLLFLSYQTSIEGQFEDVVDKWMNDPSRPSGTGAGEDVLIGQDLKGSRSMRLWNGERDVPLDVEERWVTPSGGLYAFAPSLSALDRLAQE